MSVFYTVKDSEIVKNIHLNRPQFAKGDSSIDYLFTYLMFLNASINFLTTSGSVNV